MSASATNVNDPTTARAAAAAPPGVRESDAPVDHELVIQPSRGWMAVDWRELVRYRELLFFLVWRDVKVRYKQTVLGVAWAVLQPVLQVVIYTAIFGVALNMRGITSGENVPYPLVIFLGLLPWQLFAAGLNSGGLSLVNQQHLLTKIYFPRLFVPTSAVGGTLIDLAISLGVVAVVMLFYGFLPPWTAVFLPLLVLLTLLATLGMAYTLSALTVTYRDFRFLIPFMVQVWMWISFAVIAVPPGIAHSRHWQPLLYANPMYGIIAAFRKAVLGYDIGWHWTYLASATAISLALFFFGLFFFRRTERRFADIA
jgi:lipopolysaccharide transport system permease protein